MSFTAQSVIDLARSLWREAENDDIMSDAACLLWINQAVVKIRSKRTDSRMSEDGTIAEFTGVPVTSTEIPLDVKFQLACTYFLTAHGFGRSADVNNLDARFKDWMGLYESEIATA